MLSKNKKSSCLAASLASSLLSFTFLIHNGLKVLLDQSTWRWHVSSGCLWGCSRGSDGELWGVKSSCAWYRLLPHWTAMSYSTYWRASSPPLLHRTPRRAPTRLPSPPPRPPHKSDRRTPWAFCAPARPPSCFLSAAADPPQGEVVPTGCSHCRQLLECSSHALFCVYVSTTHIQWCRRGRASRRPHTVKAPGKLLGDTQEWRNQQESEWDQHCTLWDAITHPLREA